MGKSSRQGADYRVMAGPPYWQRRTSSGWHTMTKARRYKPHSINDPMVLFVVDTGGTVYFMRKHVMLTMKDLPLHYTVIAEGPKSTLWEQFLAYGRMAVTS